jgi:hypothetical protein
MSEQESETLKAYRVALNKIEDYFEYSNKSTEDKVFVYRELSILAGTLKSINNAGRATSEANK